MIPEPTPPESLALGIVLPVIGLCAVALRFVSKRMTFASHPRPRRFGADDWLILFCAILMTALGALQIAGTVQKGYGYHSPGTDSTVPPSQQALSDAQPILLLIRRYASISNWLTPLILGCSKLSVLFLYRAVFVGRKFDILSKILIACCVLWTLCGFFFTLLQCGRYVQVLWGSAGGLVTKNCLQGANIAISIAAFDVALDLSILTFPMFLIWPLELGLWQKICITFVFLFGGLTVMASIFKLIVFSLVYPVHNTLTNQLGYVTSVAYWNLLEDGLSVIAACLPCLAPLAAGHKHLSFEALMRTPQRAWRAVSRKQPSENLGSSQQGERAESQMHLKRAASNGGHELDDLPKMRSESWQSRGTSVESAKPPIPKIEVREAAATV